MVGEFVLWIMLLTSLILCIYGFINSDWILGSITAVYSAYSGIRLNEIKKK